MRLLIVLYIIIRIIYSNGLTIDEYCAQNNIIVVKNAFRLENVIVLFLENHDKTTKVFKITELRYRESEKLSNQVTFLSITEWTNWNRHKNGTTFNEMNDFITAYRIVLLEEIPPVYMGVTLIFTKPTINRNLIGFEVEYDRGVNYIENMRKFNIDIYKSNINEPINLRDLYLNFPLKIGIFAKPIVPVPVYRTFPHRVLVYFGETKPNNSETEIIHKIHIIKELKNANGSRNWIPDKESGECFDMHEEITAAVTIGDIHYKYVKTTNAYDIYFYVIEFDMSEQFSVRKIRFESNGRIKNESFDAQRKSDSRDNLICKAPVKEHPTDPSDPNDYDFNASTPQSKSSQNKTKGWVYVILIIFVILIIIAIVSAIYWYTQRTKSSSDSNTEPQQTSEEQPTTAPQNTGTQTEQTEIKASDNKTDNKDTVTEPTNTEDLPNKVEDIKTTSPVTAPLQSTKEDEL